MLFQVLLYNTAILLCPLPFTSSSSMVVLESVLSFTCDPSPFLVMMERPVGTNQSGNSAGARWPAQLRLSLLCCSTFLITKLSVWLGYLGLHSQLFNLILKTLLYLPSQITMSNYCAWPLSFDLYINCSLFPWQLDFQPVLHLVYIIPSPYTKSSTKKQGQL